MSRQRLSWKLTYLCRGYATDRSRGSSDTIDLPYVQDLTQWPQTKRFTPYDVLGLDAKAPYDKSQFYKLAMIYHPDTWRYNTYYGIPKAVRVERYGLLVTAHRILSNPTQKRAYDLHGVGWEHGTLATSSASRYKVPYHQRRLTQPARKYNTLYTMWEFWYEPILGDRDSQRQKGLFICNRQFGLLLLVILVMCACVQVARVNHGARQRTQGHDRLHDTLSWDPLLMARDSGCLSRQRRMERFVRHRGSAIEPQVIAHGKM